MKRIWFKSNCIKAAKKCKSRTEFQQKFSAAYKIARRYGFIEDCFQHIPEIGNKYKRFVYKITFLKSKTSYVYIGLTLNPVVRLLEHKKSNKLKPYFNYKWKFEVISPLLNAVDAAKLECKKIEELRNNNKIILLNAKSGGCLGTLPRKWTFAKVKKLAKKYKTKTHFRTENEGAYSFAFREKILNEICLHMTDGAIKWNLKTVFLEARKYNSRSEFAQKSGGAYNAARKMNILPRVCKHMGFCGNFVNT